MGIINAKTPSMVKKTIWVYMIGYNIVRIQMLEAGIRHNKLPWQLSFRAAQQIIESFSYILRYIDSNVEDYIDQMLKQIASHTVGNRPNRYEPRAVKRRNKPYSLLTIKRTDARKKLWKGYKGKKPIH